MGSICDYCSLDPVPGGSLFRKMVRYPKSWVLKAGVWLCTKALAPLYDKSHLHQKITDIVGETRLADTLTNVVIPAYDMNGLHPVIFSTQQAGLHSSQLDFIYHALSWPVPVAIMPLVDCCIIAC